MAWHLRKKKERIYIATGRPYRLIDNIEGIKHLVDGYITANGAYCFSGNQVISCCPIPMDQVTSVIELSDKMGFACMIVREQDIMMYNNNPAADHIFKDMLNVPELGKSTSLQTILGQRILQLSFIYTIYSWCSRGIGNRCLHQWIYRRVSKSENHYAEKCPKGVAALSRRYQE